MLRNWVTQFGYASGKHAGDEGVSAEDRRKFIGQIGHYFGWHPPTQMNWMVEVAKDDNGKYVMVFMRYATDDEAEIMLGKNYEKYEAVRRKNLGLPELDPNDRETPIEGLSCGSTCLPFDNKNSLSYEEFLGVGSHGGTQINEPPKHQGAAHYNTAFAANAHR